MAKHQLLVSRKMGCTTALRRIAPRKADPAVLSLNNSFTQKAGRQGAYRKKVGICLLRARFNIIRIWQASHRHQRHQDQQHQRNHHGVQTVEVGNRRQGHTTDGGIRERHPGGPIAGRGRIHQPGFATDVRRRFAQPEQGNATAGPAT